MAGTTGPAADLEDQLHIAVGRFILAFGHLESEVEKGSAGLPGLTASDCCRPQQAPDHAARLRSWLIDRQVNDDGRRAIEGIFSRLDTLRKRRNDIIHGRAFPSVKGPGSRTMVRDHPTRPTAFPVIDVDTVAAWTAEAQALTLEILRQFVAAADSR